MTWRGDDFFKLTKILSVDLMDTLDRLRNDASDQPTRRNFVRIFCSQVEAFAYSTKQILAEMAQFPFVKLTPHEVLLLREEAYEVKDNGELKLKTDKFVPIRTNLKFIAKSCSKAFSIPYELDTTGPGWAALDQTFEVRNRLVHPKAFQEMFITDEELKRGWIAQEWFQKLHLSLWSLIDAGLKGTKP